MNMYQEELMEHYRNPQHNKRIESPDFSAEDDNPSCGDRVCMMGTIRDGVITDIGFQGSGCVLSQATSSMLAEYAQGKTVDAVRALTKKDITDMVGLSLGPNRIKCVLLPLFVLHAGLRDKIQKGV